MATDDLSDVVDSFADGTYTVTRRAASTYVDGRLQAPATTTLSILASVQPASGRDIQYLPEGMRSSKAFAVWTSTQLYSKVIGVNDPDQLTIDGDTYEVAGCEQWNASGAYWRALVVRLGH